MQKGMEIVILLVGYRVSTKGIKKYEHIMIREEILFSGDPEFNKKHFPDAGDNLTFNRRFT